MQPLLYKETVQTVTNNENWDELCGGGTGYQQEVKAGRWSIQGQSELPIKKTRSESGEWKGADPDPTI